MAYVDDEIKRALTKKGYSWEDVAIKSFLGIVPLHDEHNQWTPTEKITCEVTGEMSNGAKVWTDVETGEQYFLTRMLGKYMFYHI